MAIKTILAPVLGRKEDTVVLEAALAMAALQGAHIFVTHLGRDPRAALAGQVGEGMSGSMLEQLVQAGEKQLATSRDTARASFDAWVRATAVAVTEAPTSNDKPTASFESLVGEPGSMVARRGRLCSVTVVARTDETAGADAKAVLEAAMMETGRAVLYVPEDRHPKAISAIGVAWNGSREAARALALSMPLLEQAPAVHVIAGTSDLLTTDDVGACVQALQWHEVKAAARTFAVNGGSVSGRLQAEAREAGCQLLVLGAYSHSRLREFIFGGVTDDVLAAVRMPVLLAH